MHRLCLLVLLVLTACQIAPPVRSLPRSNPTPWVEASAVVAASASARSLAATWTPVPTPIATPQPTTTLTPTPAPTAVPTSTPTSAPVAEPVILIERPLLNEFVSDVISVAGRVAHVTGGSVSVELRALDGQTLDQEPVVAMTTAAGDGLGFTAEILLEPPPTPRPYSILVAWFDDQGTRAAEAAQPINLLGRYPRVDRLAIELPQPFMRGAEATILVRGVTPGPPAKILARLLDNADQVLETAEARMLWLQPGLPCAFEATLSNNPAATQVQVITLGPDDAVIEAARVRLEPRA